MPNKIYELLHVLGASADDTGCTEDLVVVSRSALFEATQACQRLSVAAQTVLENIIDAEEYGPHEHPDDSEKYVADDDGDLWYPDVWELQEVLFGNGNLKDTSSPLPVKMRTLIVHRQGFSYAGERSATLFLRDEKVVSAARDTQGPVKFHGQSALAAAVHLCAVNGGSFLRSAEFDWEEIFYHLDTVTLVPLPPRHNTITSAVQMKTFHPELC